jgi:hypothetical protein
VLLLRPNPFTRNFSSSFVLIQSSFRRDLRPRLTAINLNRMKAMYVNGSWSPTSLLSLKNKPVPRETQKRMESLHGNSIGVRLSHFNEIVFNVLKKSFW